MKLSTKTRYGARALLELASSYEKQLLPVSVIAKHQNISEKYLQNILLLLIDAGIVKSARGKNGGFSLSRAPSEITLSQVVKVLEEDGGCFVDCSGKSGNCEKKGCVMRDVWKNVADTFYKSMENITFENIMRMRDEKEPVSKILDFVI